MKVIENFVINHGTQTFRINGYIDTLSVLWNDSTKGVTACCLKEENVETVCNVEFRVIVSYELWKGSTTFRQYTYKGSVYQPILRKMFHIFVKIV